MLQGRGQRWAGELLQYVQDEGGWRRRSGGGGEQGALSDTGFVIEAWPTYHIIFASGVRRRDSTFIYMTQCSPSVWLPSVTVERYDSIIDYIPYVVLYGPVMHLFCNWKLVPPHGI